MKRHLQQAGLCQACIDRLADTIARDPQQAFVMTWCPHRRTFAKAGLEDGYVARWELASPIDEAQAREIIERQAVLAIPTSPLPGSQVQ